MIALAGVLFKEFGADASSRLSRKDSPADVPYLGWSERPTAYS